MASKKNSFLLIGLHTLRLVGRVWTNNKNNGNNNNNNNIHELTPPVKASIFTKYTYLVVVVAAITTKLRCHHLSNERCATTSLLMTGVQEKRKNPLVSVNIK